MYNRKPTLPIDVKYSLKTFDKEPFDPVLTTAIFMSANIHQTSGENICWAQEKRRRDYNRRHQVSKIIKVCQKVRLKNERRKGGKGGKFSFKWFGSFTVHSISNKNLCS